MQIFDSPHIIISLLLLCFVLLAAAGIFFVVRGINAATGSEERDFTRIKQIEKSLLKATKQRADRCIVYISVSLDNYRSLYSATRAAGIFDEIKSVLLCVFADGDDSTIAMSGETNFVAFGRWNADHARNKIELCQSELGKCLLTHNALNVVNVHLGYCATFGTQVSFDEAIDRAKQACMLAKQENLAYVEWNTNNSKALTKKIKLENNIEREIDNNRFFLEYQPVLDAKTKKIVGAEVLSRLNSENDGILTPGSFLSAVNSVGLSGKFDYYIFEKNCKWISNDRTAREQFRYTINFSRSTLCDPTFPQKIIDIAEKYDLNASCLAVEVLEDKNVTIEAHKQMRENLLALKEKGFSVLLDDFGSGYTAFNDLQTLDVSIVKIDKSITQNATTVTGFIILRNMIQTAKDIGFETLCEGVETEAQERAVIKAGCDLLQGYYYYRPMPVAQLEKLLDKGAQE